MNTTTTPARGYKVFNPDLSCRGFQFEVGKDYKLDGPIEICRRGFHFCLKAAHCFSYYKFDSQNRVCEVEALGVILTHDKDSKICTDHIRIIRELSWQEVLVVANDGKNNTGHSNSGDSNSGDSNSGNRNSGDSNSGNRNSGNRNSGYSNSGNWNSGNWNSGDSNSGYRNSGAFCTDDNPVIWLFDSPTNIRVRDWENSEVVRTMWDLLETTIWVDSSNMSEEQKDKHPTHTTTGGFLKVKTMHEAWQDMWGNLTEEKRRLFTSLPNFDATKFEKITGIKV